MTTDLETVAGLAQGFDKVQTLRDILDTMYSIKAHCAGDLRVALALEQSVAFYGSSFSSSLDQYLLQLNDQVDCTAVLTNSITNLIDFVSTKWIQPLADR